MAGESRGFRRKGFIACVCRRGVVDEVDVAPRRCLPLCIAHVGHSPVEPAEGVPGAKPHPNFMAVATSRWMLGEIPVVPERVLPPGDAALVMAARAEPEDVVIIGVEENREQGAARFPVGPTPATQRRGVVVLGGLGDDLCPVVEEPLGAGRERRRLAIGQQQMAQMTQDLITRASPDGAAGKGLLHSSLRRRGPRGVHLCGGISRRGRRQPH